jgi:hypothetical protein
MPIPSLLPLINEIDCQCTEFLALLGFMRHIDAGEAERSLSEGLSSLLAYWDVSPIILGW